MQLNFSRSQFEFQSAAHSKAVYRRARNFFFHKLFLLIKSFDFLHFAQEEEEREEKTSANGFLLFCYLYLNDGVNEVRKGEVNALFRLFFFAVRGDVLMEKRLASAS